MDQGIGDSSAGDSWWLFWPYAIIHGFIKLPLGDLGKVRI